MVATVAEAAHQQPVMPAVREVFPEEAVAAVAAEPLQEVPEAMVDTEELQSSLSSNK
jgi:hypothetical protein